VFVLALSSCATVQDNTEYITRGTGAKLGTVFASASVTENRTTGEITGDTKKYGYIEGTINKNDSRTGKMIKAAVSPAMETAQANAIYEIIKQIRNIGGNAITNVVSKTHREYDPITGIETVTVTITADAVKSGR
jgi:uncharacterized protein YbjQ (UPF0145 family)